MLTGQVKGDDKVVALNLACAVQVCDTYPAAYLGVILSKKKKNKKVKGRALDAGSQAERGQIEKLGSGTGKSTPRQRWLSAAAIVPALVGSAASTAGTAIVSAVQSVITSGQAAPSEGSNFAKQIGGLQVNLNSTNSGPEYYFGSEWRDASERDRSSAVNLAENLLITVQDQLDITYLDSQSRYRAVQWITCREHQSRRGVNGHCGGFS